MKVTDILEHFLSRCDWIDRDKTVDRVIAGDPDADVDRCLVTWMPSMAALRCTADRDIRLLVCHEPTFWNHVDDRPAADDPDGEAKAAYIEQHDLVIVRNHDCWDLWPGVGIPWAWGEFLQLGRSPTKISPNRYQLRYDIQPLPLEAFARRVAKRCEKIGEPLVQVTGDPPQPVSKIGVGTGCGCDIPTYQQMGCDCSIVCDDGSCYWAGIQRAADCDHPVIRVNHGTSEEPGMVSMTKYINDHLEGLRAELLPHGSTFRLMGAGESEG